jgi:GTP cyclohydrolase I
METINSRSQTLEGAMSSQLIITWTEVKHFVSTLDKEKKYYGVPRGGSYLSAMINPVSTPEEADIIIDDLIDSGATKERYALTHPEKPFVVMLDKTTDKFLTGKWIVFPWELEEKPAEDNFTRILQYIGEDPNRQGLVETPKRYLKFLKEFLTPPPFEYTCFDAEGTDEMIIQTNIPFHSLCEHHVAPFFGVGAIAYVPDKKIVGLSKLARCLEWYSRRLQNQERITTQVAESLMKELDAKGVAVSLKAQHLCMAMRGVKKHDTWTTTSKLLGVFKEDASARSEFLHYIK